MKDSFVFRKEWRDAVSGMSAEMRLEFYEAVIEYATTGNEPNLKPMARLAFNFAKTSLDKDSEKYEEVRKKRSEAGKAHKGNQYTQNGTSVPKMEQDGTNGTDNVYVNVMGSTSVEQIEELSKESEKKKLISPILSQVGHEFEYLKKFLSNRQGIEQLLMSFGMKPTDKKILVDAINEIYGEWQLQEKAHTSGFTEFAQHMTNTLRIRLKNEGIQKPKSQDVVLRKEREKRQRDTEELLRRFDENRKNSVSYQDAKNSEEYRRALAEA